MTTELPVTQEDREAAWPIWKWLFDDDDGYAKAQFMDGDCDGHHLLQSYAKHRLAEREYVLSLVETYDPQMADLARNWIERGDHEGKGR